MTTLGKGAHDHQRNNQNRRPSSTRRNDSERIKPRSERLASQRRRPQPMGRNNLAQERFTHKADNTRVAQKTPPPLAGPEEYHLSKKDAAILSSHVYGDKTDEMLELGGWRVSDLVIEGVDYETEEGLNSQLYERTVDGKKEYVYATAGTVFTDTDDWKANLSQPLGASEQYDQSVENASKISEAIGDDAQLTFVGHSLGGGEATANAYATGRDAVTFNAAGVSDFTQKENPDSQVDAYIMRTDPLNLLQNNNLSGLGLLMPDVDGDRHYEMNYSTNGIFNGHSMENFLDIYGVDGSKYKKSE